MKSMKSIMLLAFAALVFAMGIGVGIHLDTAGAAPAENARVYELRTYTTNEGKLDALHERFSNHTNHLFVKNGMTLIGYWTRYDGQGVDNTLTYLIAHESREAAKENWSAFVADPAWREAYAKSREDGALVRNIESQYLVPTDYSPLR